MSFLLQNKKNEVNIKSIKNCIKNKNVQCNFYAVAS